MVSVKEILELPAGKELKVIAGQGGLNRQVSTVSVMDALDIYKWMKGGEFLITSGGPIKDNPQYLGVLIKKLNHHGASAFGIKTKRFLGKIPQEAIDIANELCFPLIEIPSKYAFTDIINPVLGEVISHQERQLRFSETIHKSFTKLALTGESVEKILETLECIIHRKVAFFDVQFLKLFVPSNKDVFYEKLLERPIDGRSYEYFKKQYDYYEISNETTHYGAIIMAEESEINKENQNIALEHAATILILDTQRRISNQQVETRFRDEFIHDIIYNNINTEVEFQNRARLYGWNFMSGGLVVIVDIDDFKQNYNQTFDNQKNLYLEFSMQMLFHSITRVIKTRFEQVAYSKLNDYIVFIIHEDRELILLQQKIEHVFEEVQKEIRRKIDLTATIAIGRYKNNPMELFRSFEEARKCVLISHNLKRRDVIIFYDKLGIYKLINLVLDTEESSELLESYIYKLKEYDINNSCNLLDSLITVCENSWNLKLASKELFIHYNTMKYRYHKISQILHSDFKNMDDRINVEMAIKIYQMIR